MKYYSVIARGLFHKPGNKEPIRISWNVMSGFNVAVAQLMSQKLRLSTQPFEEKDPFVMDAVPFSRKKMTW